MFWGIYIKKYEKLNMEYPFKDIPLPTDEEIALAEDQLFVMTHLGNASRARRIADILYIYRENDSSASNTPSSDKLLISYTNDESGYSFPEILNAELSIIRALLIEG